MGPRRAGKSRLIQKVLENSEVAYLNFEEEQFTEASGHALIEAAHEVYPQAKYCYLDEAQDYPDWETLLNKLHRRGYNLFVTGSNAKLLSSELASALTGRHIPIELLPFSFAEFIQAKEFKESRSMPKNWESFEDYLSTGGFPEIVLSSGIVSGAYLNTLFDSIILNDLVKRKSIRNPTYLANCVSLLVNNVASRTSARALAKALKNTPTATTIDKYLEMIREAYLVETIGAYRPKLKERLQSERKPYLIDTGFTSVRSRQALSVLGRQLENSVYLALRRKGLVSGESLFYYRSESGLEVDFLVRRDHQTEELIQVCLDLSSIETRAREIHALEKAKIEHPIASLTIVTAKDAGTVQTSAGDTITLVPAYEFCVES